MKTFLAIAVSIVAGQYFWLSDTWFAYGLSLNIQVAVAWALAFYFIPYSRLMEKTAAFIFMLSYVVDIVAYLLPISDYAVAINFVVVVAWLAFAFKRKYTLESVVPEKGKLYKAVYYPDSWYGFAVSLLKYPVASYGVYLDGKVYAYRHHSFQKYDMQERTILLETDVELTPARRKYLEGKLGVKWTWRNHCLNLWRQLSRVR